MFFHSLTDRAILRLVCPEDAMELFILTEANRDYLRQWLPWLDGTRVVDDTEKFIELMMQQYVAGEGLTALILVDEAIAGVVGYNCIDRINHVGYIGYWLGSNYQGQGLMTNSCRAIIEYGFAAIGLDRIVIACATKNNHSRAIPVRLGFIHEGTIRDAEWLYDHYVDHEIYALQRSQI
jgi:ribosomal-protein-serine acetyltransferase